jgi:hypothetical protein
MRAPRLCRKSTSKRGGSPSTRRKAVQILAPALGLFMSVASAAASANIIDPARQDALRSVTIAGSGTLQQDTWEDIFLWYLVWLHQRIGGDPASLQYVLTAQCMTMVSDFYVKHGMPEEMSEDELAQFRAVLEVTSDHLDSAPSWLSPSAIANFRLTLRMMYTAVGGDPDTLP